MNRTMHRYAHIAAEKYRLPTAILYEPTKAYPIVFARQLAFGLIFHGPDRRRWPFAFSTPRIGRHFGRDHSTVVRGVRAYERWCAGAGIDPGFEDANDQIRLLRSHLPDFTPKDSVFPSLMKQFRNREKHRFSLLEAAE